MSEHIVQFCITNLITKEKTFSIPSLVGEWLFTRCPNYPKSIDIVESGRQCANMFFASNVLPSKSSLQTACTEIIDICLILSFFQARCITVSGSGPASDVQFLGLGNSFIRPRSIAGFPQIDLQLDSFFNDWFSWRANYKRRRLRLFLCHWLSGLTCFSLEDLFLSLGVQMDIVKQCERSAFYYTGMQRASRRYGLISLNADYKKMRNDIVHEGVLSGSNFERKSKKDCANVVADVLNWIDSYVLAVLGKSGFQRKPRWKGIVLETGLPAFSIR